MDLKRLQQTNAPAAVVLIRIMVGAVFLSEGLQKFLFAAERGAGRFAKIGIPAPEIMGPFVGVVEVVCGALLIVGLLTRVAGLFLLINMTVAIVSTKIPILLGHGFWTFTVKSMPQYGFWSMAHEGRTDFCMWLGSLYLILVGGGVWSIDAMRTCNEHSEEPPIGGG